MKGKRVLRPTDLAGLETGLSQVSGTPQERFFQQLVAYFIGWLEANSRPIADGRVADDRALLVVYSESPKLDTGIPASACVEATEVFAALCTLSDGVAVAVESLSQVIRLVPHFKGGATEAFEFIRDHLTVDRTFALLMFRQDRILVHDEGVEIEAWLRAPRVVKVQQMAEAAITPDLIDTQLDEFHSDALASPQGTTARLMWQISEEPKLSVLGPKPELHVQSALLTYFRGIYRKTVAFADEEVALNRGRVDIRIARVDKAHRRALTMIELKVLDPENSAERNLKWACKGISQAHGYAKTRDTDAAFACIYDARRDKSDAMPSLHHEADAKGVQLKVHAMEVPDPRPPKKIRARASGAATPAKPARALRAAPPAKKAARSPAAKKSATGGRTAPKKA